MAAQGLDWTQDERNNLYAERIKHEDQYRNAYDAVGAMTPELRSNEADRLAGIATIGSSGSILQGLGAAEAAYNERARQYCFGLLWRNRA